jgi:hypothetical protein
MIMEFKPSRRPDLLHVLIRHRLLVLKQFTPSKTRRCSDPLSIDGAEKLHVFSERGAGLST